MTRGRRGVYVETGVSAGLDQLWRHTQDPALHQQWDLRFGRIEYLPVEVGQPQRLRYATTVLPGLTIDGAGVCAGEHNRPDGTRTSVLRFGSEHRLSLVRFGQGYWRYVPVAGGVRFLTGYDYTPGWGRLGPIADRVFRPMFGWATAWSFDRLRLWLEHGVPPRRALRSALIELAARIGVISVALAGRPPWAVAAAVVAVVLPPHPRTPAARRCLRRPPDTRASRPPRTLANLEQPCLRSSS